MTEEIEGTITPEQPTEQPTAQPAEEIKKESNTMVDNANNAAERLEAANKKQEELIIRQEALNVQATLGGKGNVQIEKKEESDADYAKRVMANDI